VPCKGKQRTQAKSGPGLPGTPALQILRLGKSPAKTCALPFAVRKPFCKFCQEICDSHAQNLRGWLGL